jgi:hypothetical protein
MPDNRREQPPKRNPLMHDIQDLVRKRGIKQEVKVSEGRKHVEIQLLLSELENLLLNLSQTDKRVVAARAKLLELKKLIAATLDIK